MARLARLTVAHQPHHIIQRGNNRQAIFGDAADREAFLGLLHEAARASQVAVHAYVLMDNHFHLLATPATDRGLAALMQALGRAYVRTFNQRYHRTGTLWEGRFRSTVIQAEHYLLPCMVYIDLNPVRAGLVAQASDYPWSSHAHFIGRRSDRLLSPHPLYWALGNTPFAREQAYGELVQQGLALPQQQTLTDAALRGWALGDAAYLASLQKQTQRRVQPARAGRPRLRPGVGLHGQDNGEV